MRRALPLLLLLSLLLAACGVVSAPPASSVKQSIAAINSLPQAGRSLSVPAAASSRVQAFAGAPQTWSIVAQDDFANADLWTPDQIDGGGVATSASELTINVEPGWMISSQANNSGDLADAYVEATFSVEGDGSAGIIARYGPTEDGADSNIYLCYVQYPDAFACFRRQNAYWSQLFVGQSNAIHATGENTAALQMVGGNMLFAINGVTVASFNDFNLPRGGFGVFAQSGEEATVAHFSHVMIAAPGPGTPVPPQPTARPGENGTIVGLDPTFGSSGRLTIDMGSDLDNIHALVAQPDGKIIAAGEVWPADVRDPRFTLIRLNPDGSLDPTFGDGGKVFTAIAPEYDYSIALAVALQPDGKIVAAGKSNDPATHDPAFALVRYNADGSLDESFGNGGKVLTRAANNDLDTYDEIHAIAIQPDGKIVAVGVTGVYPTDFALVRYNKDGSIDTTFGARGKTLTDFSGGADVANAVALQPDGKIVVAGSAESEVGSFENNDFAVARYTKDGKLDRTFGTGGKATLDLYHGAPDYAYGVAVTPEGKVVLGGSATNGATFCQTSACWRPGMAVAQYTKDGKLDRTFGDNGFYVMPEVQADGYSMVRLPDGTIALAGRSGNRDFALGLFTAAGKPMPGFGKNGLSVTSFSQYQDNSDALALLPNGGLISGGNASVDPDEILNGDFALIGYR